MPEFHMEQEVSTGRLTDRWMAAQDGQKDKRGSIQGSSPEGCPWGEGAQGKDAGLRLSATPPSPGALLRSLSPEPIGGGTGGGRRRTVPSLTEDVGEK